MAQGSGISLFASGDYVLDDHQRNLYNTIERLQAYMASLKSKLEKEKMLLSELKAETQNQSSQQARGSVEEIYMTDRPGLKPEVADRKYYSNFGSSGDVEKRKLFTKCNGNLDSFEYLKKLREIDGLCREEMARVNSVVEKMEPLKQIASDWSLEYKLNEISPEPSSVKKADAIANGEVKHYDDSMLLEQCISSKHANLEAQLVLPTGQDSRAILPKPVFIAEGKYESNACIEITLDQQFAIKSEVTGKSYLMLDTKLKQSSKSELDLGSVDQLKCKMNMTTCSSVAKKISEGKLNAVEILKEENIAVENNMGVISVEGTSAVSQKEVDLDENSQPIASELPAMGAISLESIELAFAKHRKKKSSRNRNKTTLPGFLTKNKRDKNVTQSRERENKCKKNNKSEKDLIDNLHPCIQRIVKNWGGFQDHMNTKSNVSNVNAKHRKNEIKEPLCEDDVINKFLYDEEDYVYSPLFASENDENSTDEN